MTRPLLVGPLPRDLAEMGAHALHGERSEIAQAIAVQHALGWRLPDAVYTRSAWVHEAVRRWHVGGAEVAA